MVVKIDRTKLSKEEVEYLDELEALAKEANTEPVEPDPVPEAIQKMLDAQTAAVKKANDRADALETQVKIEKDAREKVEFTKIAHETLAHLPGTDEEKGTTLQSVNKALPKDVYEKVVTLLKSGEEAMVRVLNSEVGGDDGAVTGSAFDKIQTIAKELVKAGKAPTLAQAIDQVGQDRPELFQEHLRETRRVVAS